jgi:hypothetical protein
VKLAVFLGAECVAAYLRQRRSAFEPLIGPDVAFLAAQFMPNSASWSYARSRAAEMSAVFSQGVF